jgi:flagellar basal-body rod modification protein FlgD
MNLHGISTMAPISRAQMNSTGATGASGSSNSTGDAQSTFISLLVTELQAQDPTQPMSPDQMVSQMFSMNQLEQLISINQTLSSAFAPLTGATNNGSPTTNQIPTGGH